MNLFIDFIPVFINSNATLIIALISLCVSIYAINMSFKASDLNRTIAKEKNQQKSPDKKMEVLREIDRQNTILGNLLVIFTEKLFIYKSDSRFFFKHSNEIEKLEQNIKKIKALRTKYESYRSTAEKAQNESELDNLENSLAKTKDINSYIEYELTEEENNLKELKQSKPLL